jgi:hypothetical protein
MQSFSHYFAILRTGSKDKFFFEAVCVRKKEKRKKKVDEDECVNKKENPFPACR